MFQIDLSPEGELLLFLPTGRNLTISADETGIQFILKILRDNHAGMKRANGYVKGFPTQHNIEQWLKEKRKRDAEEKKEKTGIDIGRLGISI